MKYCEDCRIICETDTCPLCDSDELREVTENDYCFLIECEEAMGEMLDDALSQQTIKAALMPYGDGARSALGLNLGYYRVYVPYKHYDEARDVATQLSLYPTESIREDLLENKERWHVRSNFAHKRMRKKLKLSEDEELIACVKEAVMNASEITDNGVISSCEEGGHYIAIQVKGRRVWFNSATYEIFM